MRMAGLVARRLDKGKAAPLGCVVRDAPKTALLTKLSLYALTEFECGEEAEGRLEQRTYRRRSPLISASVRPPEPSSSTG